MNIEILSQTKHRIPRSYIKNWLKYVERQLIKKKKIKKNQLKEINIIFVSKKKIKKLNKEYRNNNKPTDVLSFAGGDGLLGELVLCPEVCKAQASENNQSFRDEVAYLVLHGLLHLLGYEHESGGLKAKAMFSLQDEIFEGIGRFNL